MKMRYHNCNILLAVTLIILSGCATDEKQAENPPITIAADTIGHETNNNIYTTWEEFYKKEDISFTLDSFLKNDTIIGELHITSYKPNDTFYRNFGNLLVYNSDSSMFIDAFSTNWIIERDGNGKLTAREGEIDQEVTVVDKKAQTIYSTRVLEKNGNKYSYTVNTLNGKAPVSDAVFVFDKKNYAGVEEIDLR